MTPNFAFFLCINGSATETFNVTFSQQSEEVVKTTRNEKMLHNIIVQMLKTLFVLSKDIIIKKEYFVFLWREMPPIANT